MKIIKKGYKQTEVGVIPEDWEVTTIGEISTVVTGGTPSTSHEEYWNGDIKWMSSGELNFKHIFDVKGRITVLGLENSSTHEIPSNCVLIGLAGQGKTRGTAAYNHISLCINQSIAAVLPNENFTSDYLYYYIDNKYKELRLLSSGDGGRGGLNKRIIERFSVILPRTTSEQKNIAIALSDIDSLISSLNKKIEKKKAFKQGLMQQLLTGKKRLSGFSEEWVEKKFGDVGFIIRGVSFNPDKDIKEYSSNDSIPLLRSNNISDFNLNCKDLIYVDKDRVSKIQYIINNDILICSANGSKKLVGKSAFIKDFADLTFGAFMSVFRINKNINAKYFSYLMQIGSYKRYIDETLSGSAINNLNSNDILNYSFMMPKKQQEINAIATILSDVDKDILATEASRDKYIQIKSAMMQLLLTGKIRLVEPLQEKECPDEAKVIPIDAHIVGGHIVKKLYASKGWGRTKLQKSLHLIGYCCQLDFGNEYIRNTAGPDDENLMNYIDSKFKQYHHVVKEKEIFSNGHTHYIYKPMPQITELEEAFDSYPVKLRHRINALLDKMFNMDLARAEIVSTLYAVWNNRIIKGQKINDSSILSDFYDWSKHKSDFNKDLVLKALDYMKNNDIIPIGWGKYIDKK